jgi:L-fuculose-phosphate aldolase
MTDFIPTADKLLPDLTLKEELVLLARTLWREGYDDHLAGHITIGLGDGTLLCNPWLLTWAEFRAADVIRVDLEGRVVEGDWPMPPGAQLHLELHRARPHVGVAVHHHPRFGTVWADLHRVPGVFDQSSGLGGGTVALVDEYKRAVNDPDAARAAVVALGEADIGILANHGVLIIGANVRAAHQRSVAFEQRCRNAWYVEAANGGVELPAAVRDLFERSDGQRFIGFWEAMARAELRADPTLLEPR